MTAKSKSAKYYAKNPKAKAKKKAYDTQYNKKPSAVKKRVELNKYNRKKGTYGNNDGLDASHKGKKIVGFEKASKNRGSKKNSAGDKRARGGKKK